MRRWFNLVSAAVIGGLAGGTVIALCAPIVGMS